MSRVEIPQCSDLPAVGCLSKIQNNSGLPQGLGSQVAAQCSPVMLFRAERRENMSADRAYSRGSPPFRARGASLFYFAAALPAVGFVHGSADVNPLNDA